MILSNDTISHITLTVSWLNLAQLRLAACDHLNCEINEIQFDQIVLFHLSHTLKSEKKKLQKSLD